MQQQQLHHQTVPCTPELCQRLPQVFRQNKRATDVHDILGFRVIVFPESLKTRSAAFTAGEGEGDTPTGKKEGETARKSEEQKERIDTADGSSENRPAGDDKRGGSKPGRALFTVKTFPPPYRDADSRLLHDVYEVLIGLFDEVPGRFKVGYKYYYCELGARLLVSPPHSMEKARRAYRYMCLGAAGRQKSMRPGVGVMAVCIRHGTAVPEFASCAALLAVNIDTGRYLRTLFCWKCQLHTPLSFCGPVSPAELCGLPQEERLPERAHDGGALNWA